MKTLTIGRANECDITIDDDSDQVSRRHVELTFTFAGKMMMTDLSANGTYVNGVRIKKGEAIAVRRSDNVSFAKVWNLDWDTVKNPYQPYRRLLGFAAALLAVLILATGAYLLWGRQSATDSQKPPINNMTAIPADTVVADTSLAETQPSPQRKRKSHKSKSPKSGADLNNKKLDDEIDEIIMRHNGSISEKKTKEILHEQPEHEVSPISDHDVPIIY